MGSKQIFSDSSSVCIFLGDPKMIAVAQRFGAGVCAMHMQGTPQTMQDNPSYDNVVLDVLDYLRRNDNQGV